MIPAALLLMTSFFFFLKLIIFIAWSLKYSQHFFMKSLPLDTSCLFSMFSKHYSIINSIDIEKPDGKLSATFGVDGFLGLILHASVFSIKH